MAKKHISELIVPDAAEVMRKAFISNEFADDQALIADKHALAIAFVDEQSNRLFDPTEPAFIQAKELTFSLAAWWYENPVDYELPEHLEKGLDAIRFVAGF